MDEKYNKVIGVQCYGTSGTTLMHSLLDNHPSIMGLPMLHARDLYTLWTDHIVGTGKNVERASDLHEYEEPTAVIVTIDKIISSIKQHNAYFFDHTRGLEDSLTRVGDDQNKILTVNEHDFINHLKAFFKKNKINRKNFIVSVFVAFNKCYKIKHDNDPYICIPFHDHSIEIIKKIKDDFGEIKVITMVRNPAVSIGSLIKHINFNQHKYCLFKSHLKCAISVQLLLKREHYSSKPFKIYGKYPYYPDSNFFETRYVKLENVHKNVEKQMRKIAVWLKIDFKKELLDSTYMGYKWFNRKESIKTCGIDEKIITQKFENFLTGFDRFRIKLLCMNELIYFKYYEESFYKKYLYIIMLFLILFPFKIDFNLITIKYRIFALFNIFSEKKYINIIKWIIYDNPSNTIFGPHLEEMSFYFPEKTSFNYKHIFSIRLFNFIVCLPILFLKNIYNYFNLRLIMYFIIYKIIFSKKYTDLFIRPL